MKDACLMLVTADRYSLPVMTANSWDELAQKTGRKKEYLMQVRSHKGSLVWDGQKCKVIKVKIEDDPPQQPNAKFRLQYYDANTPAWTAYKKERGIL